MSFRTLLLRATAALALAASGLAHAATQYVLLTPAPTACADAGCQVQQAKITGSAAPASESELLAQQHIRQIYATAAHLVEMQPVNGADIFSIYALYDNSVPPHDVVGVPSAYDDQGRVVETTTADFFQLKRAGLSPQVCAAIHAKGLGALDCANGTIVFLANFVLKESLLDEAGNFTGYYREVSRTFELTQAQVDAATPVALQAAPGQFQVAGI